jgi:ribose-phosphate pyrophosphokinase
MVTRIIFKKDNTTHELPIQFSRFPDGDTHCVIPSAALLPGEDVLIIHDLYPAQNDKLIQLVLLLDGLRANNVGTISVFIPYLPYARQDKSHITGETISANSVCKLLYAMGCSQLYTIDCHFMKGTANTQRCGLNIANVSASQRLIAACLQYIGHDNFEVIGPDKGSDYLTQAFGSKNMHKIRGDYGDLSKQESYRDIIRMEDKHITLQHSTVIILDDMISTGSTIRTAIESLLKRGVQHVYVAATHGLFLGESSSTLSQLTTKIITTDSIPGNHTTPLIQSILAEEILPAWENTSQGV